MADVLGAERGAWARRTVAQVGRQVTRARTGRRRKMLVVHLDGVPHALLAQAVAAGHMPFLASLLSSGEYQLDKAFWGSPASTPCFQAGFLYGLRHPNLPAYAWYDREAGRMLRMNVPADAACVEARLGHAAPGSLLEDGGSAYLSLFNAHATTRMCMTGLTDYRELLASALREAGGVSSCAHRSLAAYLAQVFRETWLAGKDVWRWATRLKDWRHEARFLFNHLAMVSLAWGVAQKRALVDMVRGVPAVYLVFGNYDEVAHRRGPTSAQATAHLYRVDAKLAELYAVGRTLEEPYDLFFLTDHGHVDSTPFERRFGQSLERYLLQGRAPPLSAELERALLDGRAPAPEPGEHAGERERPEIVDAGNFAHVYLTRGRTPLEARDILAAHGPVLARAVAQRDIALVALRQGERAVALIDGKLYGPRDVGGSPLGSGFSKRAVEDLLYELPHMKTAGDLVLYGQTVQSHGEERGTVGFAWEFGSHGGLTRAETESLICWPRNAGLDLSGLTHSTQLHQRLSEAYRN